NSPAQNATVSNGENNTTTTVAKTDQTETIKKDVRNNWYKYITLSRSNYTYREAGGIYDLYLKLTNNTDYTLSSVKTSVNYMKAKGGVYKIEYVYFANVAPHTVVSEKAPDSNRGTSVDDLIIWSIQSVQLNFCYEPGNWAANSPDPYKCQ
ncbi:MAG: hypothetical protein WCL06_14220, partial [Bacteroidota bacterium]